VNKYYHIELRHGVFPVAARFSLQAILARRQVQHNGQHLLFRESWPLTICLGILLWISKVKAEDNDIYGRKNAIAIACLKKFIRKVQICHQWPEFGQNHPSQTRFSALPSASISSMMVRFTLLASLIAGAITTVSAHPQPRDESRQIGCGTEPPAEFLEAASQISAWEKETFTNATRTDSARAATVTIDTYIHVVARSTALSGGYVPAAQLTNQISVLNEHYGESESQGSFFKKVTG